MNYLLVCTPESYEVTRHTGVVGYYDDLVNKCPEFKNAKVGEKIFIYVSKKKIIEAVGEITKSYYFDNSMIYGTDKNYVYPHRIGLKFLKENIGLDFKELISRLELIRDKSGRVVYSAYLVRTFIPLSKADGDLLQVLSGIKDISHAQARDKAAA